MGSIGGGQLGFPNPLNRVNGKQSADLFKKISDLSSSAPEESSEGRSDSVQLSRTLQGQVDQARALFFEANVRITRSILKQTSDGSAPKNQQFNVESIEVYGRVSVSEVSVEGPDIEEKVNPLASLQELFSPDNTATRILDFALSRYGYGRFEGTDSSENRAAYSDFIFPAIEAGFQEAVDAFGDLPQKIMDGVKETLAKVQIGFENFLAGAPDAAIGEIGNLDIAGTRPEA